MQLQLLWYVLCLSPPVTLCYCSFQGDTSVVVLFVYVLVFKVFFCAVGALCVFS